MPLNDLYSLKSIAENSINNYSTVVVINPKHEVFKGHFPGNAVVPGVCIMHIVKQIAQQATGTLLTLKTAANVKFLALINPGINPELQAELEITETEDNLTKIKSTIRFNDTVAVKLSCTYLKTEL